MGWPWPAEFLWIFLPCGIFYWGLFGPVDFFGPNPCRPGPSHVNWAKLTTSPTRSNHYNDIKLEKRKSITPYSISI